MSEYLIGLALGDVGVGDTAHIDELDIFYETKKDWKKNLIKKLLNKEYLAQQLGDNYKKMLEYESSLNMIIRENTAKEHNNLYCFITINPRDNVKLEDFRAKVEKLATRNMFKGYIYVFEQRGAESKEAGKGFHSHILLTRNCNYKPCKIKQNAQNTFKSITDVNNPHLLNIQFIGESFAKDKQEYITACKTGIASDGEKKSIHQEIDIVWRQQNNIEPFYGNKIFV